MSIVETIINFFGEYTPQMGVFYIYDEAMPGIVEVYQTIPGIGGLDWPWIAGVVFVLMSLYCLFRILGGIFKGVLS